MAPLSIMAACQAMLGQKAEAAASRKAFFAAAGECRITAGLTRPAEWRSFFAARWPFREPDRLEHLLTALDRAGIPVRD